MYILWIGGGLLPVETKQRGLSISAAGTNWQSGICRGLQNSGQAVIALTNAPVKSWPDGPCFGRGKQASGYEDIDTYFASYCNLPWLRHYAMEIGYTKALAKVLRENGKPSAAIFYNYGQKVDSVFRRLSEQLNIPCLIVAADYEESPEGNTLFDQALKFADGAVFLSWECSQESQLARVLHLDGGVRSLPCRIERKKDLGVFTIMYSGSYSEYCGVGRLISYFKSTPDPNVRLCLTGQCSQRELLEEIQGDSRISYHGFVSNEQLADLYSAADVFVNIYLPEYSETNGKFPSKILEYLSYLKPVMASRSAGISPEYDNCLFYFDSDSLESFQVTLTNLVEMSPKALEEWQLETKLFLEGRKLWTSQAKRLVEFINDCS